MSTNFYAVITLSDSPRTTTSWHIGKRQKEGLSLVNGTYFPTVASWVDFLRHAKHAVHVEDEYGRTYDTEEFIANELLSGETYADRSVGILNNSSSDLTEPMPLEVGNELEWKEWIDADTGKVMHAGRFF